MQYAKTTEVSVEKSRAEIEGICRRYGAMSFTSGWKEGAAMIAFEMRDRYIRFALPLPSRDDEAFAFDGRNKPRKPE
jgi:hypothetical protein